MPRSTLRFRAQIVRNSGDRVRDFQIQSSGRGSSGRTSSATRKAPGRFTTGPRRPQTRTNGRKGKRQTLAERADKYALYQKSVQDPEGDVIRVRRMYERLYGRTPRTMREDFCGTAAYACAWVAAHRENHAWGVDLDSEPLDWGRAHNVSKLRPEQVRRLHLLQDDVRTARTPKVDVVVAFNFSFFLFKERGELLRYFKSCRAALARDGIFVIDAYGGPESMQKNIERRRVGGFTYLWEQARFDPITHDASCYIHFEFRDGSKLHRAWGYHWRLWTVAELRDLLDDAGFSDTTVYWEGTDTRTNEANGVFRPRAHAEEDPAWITYLVAKK